MKCFYYFKEKTRTRGHKSAPELRNPVNKSDNSGTDSGSGVMKSTGSEIFRRGISDLYEEKSPNLRVFSWSELRIATNDFNRKLKIGEGGFGCVYQGKIKPVDGQGDPILVAVKKLNKDGFQGHKQWLAEVQFLGVVEHPNLVKLIGYCAVDGERGIQRLLVYEYMPNKSLEDHLFKKTYPHLPWEKRMQIIIGAAQGLAYLHEELEVQVIFRDFKTSNVLLDENFQAKLSDFGLAREGPTPGSSHVSTAVVGTHGYAAPDYIETGHLSSKSDVWSFGIVLYEILTGRRSLERSLPKPEQQLLSWVKQFPIEGKKFSSIIDPRLEDQYSLSAARKIAKVAESCLVKSYKERPDMSVVVEKLKEIMKTATDGGSPDKKGSSPVENEAGEPEKGKDVGVSESARRRFAHLAKLGEQVEGVGKRRFMIMQRAKVS
ncbi:probable serine/threonine-protein kinase PBL19 [Chenopodium quinoa]|uniref:non-specific serine/threonine protein kinase n=1 Tax=Chenopodium quinoa TaxID=63459 RepID=A0A803LII3_CHEQI|nr:probable serine/threonine-protein kinase PBL19 [Chenopodium quinoa]